MLIRALLSLLASVTPRLAVAGDAMVVAKSGPARVSFLELFTSEGCSSCPPADRWLSGLAKNRGLWKAFVPAAFHVDYWNGLGWKDPFSSNAATVRQHAHARDWKALGVYTPAFVLNGKEWQNWRLSTSPPEPPPGDAGSLSATKSGSDPNVFTVKYTPAKSDKTARYTFHAALVGMNMKSEISSGENSGLALVHDFVVIDWKTADVVATNGAAVKEFTFKRGSIGRPALVVWVELTGSPNPIQAAGGFL